MEQAREFVIADKDTSKHLNQLKFNMHKVDFVRTQSYLERMATMIVQQETQI
jgi:hypothetical protein